MMTVFAVVSVLLASGPQLQVEQRGTLREALTAIAREGGLNLVVTGDLSQPAEVVLKDVTAEEAIEAVAQAYQLDVSKNGKVWVLKPRAAPAPAAGSAAPAVPPVPAVPAVPPVPSAPQSPEELEAEAQAARERASALRDQAQEFREQARELAGAQREAARAAAEEAKARVDEAKARVQAGDAKALVAAGAVVVKRGTTVDSAISYGGSVTIEEGATVEEDVVAFGGDVVLEPGAKVEGDAVSFGGTVKQAPGAKVDGEVVTFGTEGLGASVASRALKAAHEDRKSDSGPSGVAGFFLRFALLFGLGFVFMMFAPTRMKQLEAEIRRAPAVNGITGFVTGVALIPLSVLLALTIVGIPVVVMMWPLAAVVALMGLTAIANVLGAKLPFFRGHRTQALVLAMGTFALSLVAAVPVLGPLVLTLLVCVSLGAAVRSRLGQRGQGLPVVDGAGVSQTVG